MQNSQYLLDVYCVPSPLIFFFYIKKEKTNQDSEWLNHLPKATRLVLNGSRFKL